MIVNNYLKFSIKADLVNESLARSIVGAFASLLNPTIDEISDIKTAVSEAVANAIIHGYNGSDDNLVVVECSNIGYALTVSVEDFGRGIEDIEKAKTPFFTTKPDEERSGLGFTVMESFMDSIEVISRKNDGTKIVLTKTIDNSEVV